MKNCGNCKHWSQELLNVAKNDDIGECLRYPPTITAPFVETFPDPYAVAKATAFPVLSYVCKCGEWAPKNQKKVRS